jgi:hypothetical protein
MTQSFQGWVASVGGLVATGTTLSQIVRQSRERTKSSQTAVDRADQCISVVKEPEQSAVFTGDLSVDAAAKAVIKQALGTSRRKGGVLPPLLVVGLESIACSVVDDLAAQMGGVVVEVQCNGLAGLSEAAIGRFVKELEAEVKFAHKDNSLEESARRRDPVAVIYLNGLNHLINDEKQQGGESAKLLLDGIRGSRYLSDGARLVARAPAADLDGVSRLLQAPCNVEVPVSSRPDALKAVLQARVPALTNNSQAASTLAEVFGSKLYVGDTLEKLARVPSSSREQDNAETFDKLISEALNALYGRIDRSLNCEIELSSEGLLAVCEGIVAQAIGLRVVGVSLKSRPGGHVVHRAKQSGETLENATPEEVAKELVIALIRQGLMSRDTCVSVGMIRENRNQMTNLQVTLQESLVSLRESNGSADFDPHVNAHIHNRVEERCKEMAKQVLGCLDIEQIKTEVAIMKAGLRANTPIEIVGSNFDSFCKQLSRMLDEVAKTCCPSLTDIND